MFNTPTVPSRYANMYTLRKPDGTSTVFRTPVELSEWIFDHLVKVPLSDPGWFYNSEYVNTDEPDFTFYIDFHILSRQKTTSFTWSFYWDDIAWEEPEYGIDPLSFRNKSEVQTRLTEYIKKTRWFFFEDVYTEKKYHVYRGSMTLVCEVGRETVYRTTISGGYREIIDTLIQRKDTIFSQTFETRRYYTQPEKVSNETLKNIVLKLKNRMNSTGQTAVHRWGHRLFKLEPNADPRASHYKFEGLYRERSFNRPKIYRLRYWDPKQCVDLELYGTYDQLVIKLHTLSSLVNGLDKFIEEFQSTAIDPDFDSVTIGLRNLKAVRVAGFDKVIICDPRKYNEIHEIMFFKN